MTSALQHGSRHERKATAPHIGRRFETKSVCIDLNPPSELEVNFQAPEDLVTFIFSPANFEYAYDSDVVKSTRKPASSLSFHPARCNVYARIDKNAPETIAFKLDRALREEITEELGHRAPTIDTTKIVKASPLAIETVKAARRFVLSAGAGGRIAAESLATLAMYEMLAALSETKAPKQKNGLGLNRISRVTDFIESHLSQNIGLSDLARQAGLSSYHFVRSFKQAMGVTPYQYIIERRIARARDRLSYGTESIASISYEVGFSSQSHMTEQFRKNLGVTPARYRAETRK